MKLRNIFLYVLCIVLAFTCFNCSGGSEEQSSSIEIKKGSAATGGGFSVTSVKKNGDYYSVELNKNLIISGIGFENGEAVFPSKKERPFFSADSDAAGEIVKSISNAVKEFSEKNDFKGDGELKKIEASEIRVKIFNRNSKVKAFIDVVTPAGLALSGIVVKYDSELSVEWPKSDEAEVFAFNNADNKKELDTKILAEFEKQATSENFDYKAGGSDGSGDGEERGGSKKFSNKEFDEVVLTEITKKGKTATIVLNGVLKISNVEIGSEVNFPERKSKGDKSFPIISADKKNSDKFDDLLTKIKSGKAVKSDGKLDISFVNVKNGKFGKVGFNNAICVDNFYIKDGEVSWPSVKSGKSKEMTPVVECLNKDLKKTVEDALLAKAKKSENGDNGGYRKKKSGGRNGNSNYKKSGKKNNKKNYDNEDGGDGEE